MSDPERPGGPRAGRGPDGRWTPVEDVASVTQKGPWPRGADRAPVKTPNKLARPGNLGNTQHPWRVYWRRRALPADKRWVLRLVEDYVPALLADKGGEGNVSAAEMKVMELAAVARVCWALAMVDGNLDTVARFVSVERSCLADLGLERRAKPVDPMQALRAAVERANEGADE
jgi:hypothetical protein